MRITGHGRVVSVLLVLVAFTIMLGLVLGALTIWPGRRSSPPPQGPPMVVVSIFPLASLCTEICGETAQVVTMLPPSASPHTYELTPNDAKTLAGASLIVQIGGGLDPFVSRLASAAGGEARCLETIAVLPADALLADDDDDHHHHAGVHATTGGTTGADPHIWLDPVLVRDFIVPALQEELSEIWPEHAEMYAANAATLQARLTELDEWIRVQTDGLHPKGLITIHPAWGYFGQRYGLDTWAVEQHAGHEPSPLWIADLIEIARTREITTLFSEPQLSQQVANVLARELGIQIIALDPIGGPGRLGYESYVQLMQTNVLAMVRGLR
jgi:zinc transport system substrate-binding protein